MRKIGKFFGMVVREHREKLGLSQEEFARHAGIHRTYVSSIELGKVQVSIAIAFQLAEALNVPLSKIWKQVEKRQGEESDLPASPNS